MGHGSCRNYASTLVRQKIGGCKTMSDKDPKGLKKVMGMKPVIWILAQVACSLKHCRADINYSTPAFARSVLWPPAR
jgi:hypothetical protein